MFAKVFRQIFASSIVERPEVRFTFMDLLILADSGGVVDMTHEAIARWTNRPIEVIRETIAELERPDPKSRTPEDEGRRIVRLDEHRDWGWLIVNYEKFRMISSEEQRKEKTRLRVARYRKKQALQNVTGVTGRDGSDVTSSNADVTSSNACNAMEKEREKEMEKEKEKEKDVSPDPKAVRAVSYDRASGQWQNITDDDKAEWRKAYPATDPEIELLRMVQWLKANPTKAVKRNWRRFITNWLSRTQDQGGTRKGVGKGDPVEKALLAEEKARRQRQAETFATVHVGDVAEGPAGKGVVRRAGDRTLAVWVEEPTKPGLGGYCEISDLETFRLWTFTRPRQGRGPLPHPKVEIAPDAPGSLERGERKVALSGEGRSSIVQPAQRQGP